ncbi:hypothetical protein ACFZAM_31915 [Streptomyces sp. NPDC008079]|uniref:hypothetical protein n=1 Tax=Streptomyces sp. NPDC008079 TaxID=3364806 RepID=UPI0036E02427
MIENTGSNLSRVRLFLDALVLGGSEGLIESQEAVGQHQFVNSDRMPADLRGQRAGFEALGFTFGEPDADDPLFMPATLPEGWTRQKSDHDMWSHILDGDGRRRADVFYKAAFFDRRAFARLADTPED